MHLNNEQQLIKGFIEKDPASFSEIINLYSDKLYSIIYRMIDNHDDIQDILQNTFLKAFKNSHKFRGDSSLYTYLVRIAINEAKMFLRKNKQNLFLEINEDILINNEYITVEEEFEKKNLRESVSSFISKLPYKYREVIILRDIEGLSTREVAKILNISENAVKIRLHRARLLLKDLMEDILERM